MAEEGTPATPDAPAEGTEGDGGGNYTPPATQADLDRIVADRVKRVKAQFADYGELKSAKTELDQIKQANQTEAERQSAELTRWQAEAEKWRTASVSSTITALATGEFADPSDAASALSDLSKYLDAGGQINEDAIRADLTEVLDRKPHWRRQESGPVAPRVPAPNPAQGTGGGGVPANPAQEFASLIQGQLRS